MTIDKDVLYMGVMVFGGLIILVVAILMFKSTSSVKNTAENKAEKPAPAPELKEKPAKKENKEKSGLFAGAATTFNGLLGKVSAGIGPVLQKIPISREQSEAQSAAPKSGSPKQKGPKAEAQAEDEPEAGPSRMPDLNSLGLKQNNLRSLAAREKLEAKAEEADASAAETPAEPAEAEAAMPEDEADDAAVAETGDDNEPESELQEEDSEDDVEEAESAAVAETEPEAAEGPEMEPEPVGELQEEPGEESEEEARPAPAGELEKESEENPEEESDEAPEDELEEEEVVVPEPEEVEETTPTRSSKSDDLFDMFKEEAVVESETAKFAKNLEDVDVHDLLEESQNLINDLSGRGGM